MPEKHPIFQGLMDDAYALLGANEWSKAEFALNLTPRQRRAVVLGNLNYQVCNGGFYQWVDNGYAEAARPFIFDAVNQIGTETAKVVAGMLREVYRIVDECDRDSKYGNMDPLYEALNEGDEDEDEDLDSRYYTINDKFLDEIEAYFTKEPTAA